MRPTDPLGRLERLSVKHTSRSVLKFVINLTIKLCTSSIDVKSFLITIIYFFIRVKVICEQKKILYHKKLYYFQPQKLTELTTSWSKLISRPVVYFVDIVPTHAQTTPNDVQRLSWRVNLALHGRLLQSHTILQVYGMNVNVLPTAPLEKERAIKATISYIAANDYPVFLIPCRVSGFMVVQQLRNEVECVHYPFFLLLLQHKAPGSREDGQVSSSLRNVSLFPGAVIKLQSVLFYFHTMKQQAIYHT